MKEFAFGHADFFIACQVAVFADHLYDLSALPSHAAAWIRVDHPGEVLRNLLAGLNGAGIAAFIGRDGSSGFDLVLEDAVLQAVAGHALLQKLLALLRIVELRHA